MERKGLLPQVNKIRVGAYAVVALAGISVLGCANSPDSTVARTPIPKSDGIEPTSTRTVIPRSAENTPVIVPSVPRATATAQAVVDRGVQFDGRRDKLRFQSSGIELSRNFSIEADVKLDQDDFTAGGDTIVSKGDNFALFARSLSVDCFGNISALIDGVDICTNGKLAKNVRYTIALNYDGKELKFFLDGEEILNKSVQGPLDVDREDINAGRRDSLLNSAPLSGILYRLTVTDNGKKVIDNQFEQQRDLEISQPDNRPIETTGVPKISQ